LVIDFTYPMLIIARGIARARSYKVGIKSRIIPPPITSRGFDQKGLEIELK